MAERIERLTIASAKALVAQAEFIEQIYNKKSSDKRIPLAYKVINDEERRSARILENAKLNAQENHRRRIDTDNVYTPREKTPRNSYQRPRTYGWW